MEKAMEKQLRENEKWCPFCSGKVDYERSSHWGEIHNNGTCQVCKREWKIFADRIHFGDEIHKYILELSRDKVIGLMVEDLRAKLGSMDGEGLLKEMIANFGFLSTQQYVQEWGKE